MSGARFVLLGLAPARAPWFEALAQWTTSTAIAAEFIKCISGEEVRARLASGRRHSALLIDASSPSFDRDVIDVARGAGTPVFAVCDTRNRPLPAADLGLTAVLDPGFGRDELTDALAAHCQPIPRGDQMPPGLSDPPAPLWLGRLIAVCGPGGTGASTVAIALAQGLGADPRNGGRAVLADLALRADQAMLHDTGDLGPGIQEIVEAHRLGRPGTDEIWDSTFDVPRRGYRLLLGLRQPHAWAALRPRAIDATLDSLRQTFQVVVADITGDVEGESLNGSVEVEERNHLARATALRSGIVVTVGTGGIKGVHSLAALVRSLTAAGVDSERIVAVVNRGPRNPATRAEIGRALTELLTGDDRIRGEGEGPRLSRRLVGGLGRTAGPLALAAPVFVPERKVEDALRDGLPLPAALVEPILRAVAAVEERLADRPPARPDPVPITPGSLGTRPEEEAGEE